MKTEYIRSHNMGNRLYGSKKRKKKLWPDKCVECFGLLNGAKQAMCDSCQERISNLRNGG